MTARSAARPFGSTGEGNCLTRAPLVSFNTYGLKHVCPRFREALKAVHVPCHRGRVDKGVTSGRPKGCSSTARLTGVPTDFRGGGFPEEAVSAVRQFLSQHSKSRLPGRNLQDYDFFQRLLPDFLVRAQQDRASLTP